MPSSTRTQSPIVISGTGFYTPPCIISNDELVNAFNQYVELFNTEHAAAIADGQIAALAPSSAAFIEKASGITQRHVIEKESLLNPHIMSPRIPERPDDQMSIQCEFMYKSAMQALESAGKKGSDVDAIICACSSFQRPYPGMAIELQQALGAGGYAFDMNVACSSATFAIQTAFNTLNADQAKCVLIVNPEICSGHINFRDRESHFIFGDACSAIVLERAHTATAEHLYAIKNTKLVTQFSNNIRNNAGFLNHLDPEKANDSDKLFKQAGRKVFKEVVPMVIDHITTHLDQNQMLPSDIHRFWLHQANSNMNELILKKLLGEVPPTSIAPIILNEYANTGSAGAIIAMHHHHSDLNAGDLALICSFGAGYSIGSILLQKQ